MLNVERVFALAKKNRYSVQSLAEAVGKQRYFFYDVKNKGVTVHKETVEKLAQVLHTTTDYLEDRTDDPREVTNTEDLVDIYKMVSARPATKVLFSTLKDASDEDIQEAIQILQILMAKRYGNR